MDLCGNLCKEAEDFIQWAADNMNSVKAGRAFSSLLKRRLSIATAKGVALTVEEYHNKNRSSRKGNSSVGERLHSH